MLGKCSSSLLEPTRSRRSQHNVQPVRATPTNAPAPADAFTQHGYHLQRWTQGAMSYWAVVVTGFGEPGKPSWDSRREMRAIRDEIARPRPSLAAIAAQLHAMKRL